MSPWRAFWQRAKSKGHRVYFPFLTRGLHTHRYKSVALTGFLETRNVERKNTRGFHFPRGLHTHRYESVALRGFLGTRREKRKKHSGLTFSEGLTPPSLWKCCPDGLLGRGLRAKGIEFIFHFLRGVYTPIAIIVSPYGLFGNPECGKKKHSGLTFPEGFTHPSL